MISFGSREERIPIIIIDIYVFLSLCLYFCGPIHFRSPYSVWMALYLFCFLLVINISYFRAVWKVHNMPWYSKETTLTNDDRSVKPLPSWFYFLGMFIPMLMTVTSVVLSGFSGLTGSLTNAMAKAYTFVQGGGTYQQGIDIPMWIYMHFAVFVYFTIIDGLLFFKEISLSRKLMWGLSVVLLIAYFVLFKGVQKTLGDVFVLCSSAILIKAYHSKRKKRRNTIMCVLVCLAIVFAFVLASIMGERISYLNSLNYEAFKLNTEHWFVNLDSLFLSILPESTRLGWACLVFYLCNGLCGLSYCLASPFTWTYGLATFPDLADILARRIGINILESTYMYEAYEKFGWHHSEQWHTLFPYLASDWTFIGALFIMGFIAYIYAVSWMESLRNRNKASIFLFSMMNIIWIYLPANNQIFSTRTTTIIFVICIIMWIRRNRNERRRGSKIKFTW